jgi:hypothetical protein
VVNLKQQADSVDQTYKNFVVVNINNHCVRLAVMQGEFRGISIRVPMSVSWSWKAIWK